MLGKLFANKWLYIAVAIGVLILMTKKISDLVSPAVAAAVNRFALAIQNAEGWFEGSWSYRTNNPGNITDMGRPGQIGTETNPKSGITFPVFDSYESGFAALVWKLKRAFTGLSTVYSPTMTISEFFEKYSHDQNEAENVSSLLGVSSDTKLSDLIEGA